VRDGSEPGARGAGGVGWEAVAGLGPRAKRIVVKARRLGGRGFWWVFFCRFLKGFFPGLGFLAGGAGFLLFPGTPVGELEGGGFAGGAAFAGGGLFVDSFDVVFDDVGVDLGSLDAAVAEHFSHVSSNSGETDRVSHAAQGSQLAKDPHTMQARPRRCAADPQ